MIPFLNMFPTCFVLHLILHEYCESRQPYCISAFFWRFAIAISKKFDRKLNRSTIVLMNDRFPIFVKATSRRLPRRQCPKSEVRKCLHMPHVPSLLVSRLVIRSSSAQLVWVEISNPPSSALKVAHPSKSRSLFYPSLPKQHPRVCECIATSFVAHSHIGQYFTVSKRFSERTVKLAEWHSLESLRLSSIRQREHEPSQDARARSRVSVPRCILPN